MMEFINEFRSWHTLLLMLIFIGIWVWAWSSKRSKSFNDAANLPFADEDKHQASMNKENES